MRQVTKEELQRLWPEGWLGRRYSTDAKGKRKAGDLVYVIPRRAQNAFEITHAAHCTRLDASRLQVIWYWQDPAELMIEPLDSKETA